MRSFIVVLYDLVVIAALAQQHKVAPELINGGILQGVTLDRLEPKIIHHLTQLLLGAIIHENKDIILRVSQLLTNVVSSLIERLVTKVTILLRKVVVNDLIAILVLEPITPPHRRMPPGCL
jgi:hypothetical protein